MKSTEFLNDANIALATDVIGQIISELPVEVGDEIQGAEDKLQMIFSQVVEKIDNPVGRAAAAMSLVKLLKELVNDKHVQKFCDYIIEAVEKDGDLNVWERITAGLKAIKALKSDDE